MAKSEYIQIGRYHVVVELLDDNLVNIYIRYYIKSAEKTLVLPAMASERRIINAPRGLRRVAPWLREQPEEVRFVLPA